MKALRLRRRLPAALVVAIALVAVAYAFVMPSWERPPIEQGTEAAPLELGQVRAVTLNAWKLAQPQRVPRLMDALRISAGILSDGGAPLPELVAIQEIESRDAARALTAALEATHHVVICECAERDGRLRSAVLVAAAREGFALEGQRCIDLGAEWPDHARCAAEATLQPAGGARLTLLGTHLGWHWSGNEAMARRLRREASIDGATVWLGDFNAAEGSDAYTELTRAPLRDTRVGAPPTHYVGRRYDLVLVSRAVGVVRGLDRRASFDALQPTSSYSLPWLPYGFHDRHCEDRPAACPLSDHLPEGAVLSL